MPMDPVNCFEKEQTDYSKYDELVAALQLSALERAILNCYMNGMRQAEVCAELGIGRGTILCMANTDMPFNFISH